MQSNLFTEYFVFTCMNFLSIIVKISQCQFFILVIHISLTCILIWIMINVPFSVQKPYASHEHDICQVCLNLVQNKIYYLNYNTLYCHITYFLVTCVFYQQILYYSIITESVYSSSGMIKKFNKLPINNKMGATQYMDMFYL